MNIVKLQEDLKNVPINNLISYVQNPNGQVPSYLALSEIKRRKDMESRAVAAKNTPSSTSVAEELTMPRQSMPMQMPQAQPQPQMEAGVASLPTGDMYQDQSFAGGGIVAFADGGDTGYAQGGEVQHFVNQGAVVFDRNMGPATFDAELDDPSIDAYTRDLILRNRSMFGSDAPIQVAGEVNPALSSSQLGQSYWQNLKRKFALQKQKEARDIAVD